MAYSIVDEVVLKYLLIRCRKINFARASALANIRNLLSLSLSDSVCGNDERWEPSWSAQILGKVSVKAREYVRRHPEKLRASLSSPCSKESSSVHHFHDLTTPDVFLRQSRGCTTHLQDAHIFRWLTQSAIIAAVTIVLLFSKSTLTDDQNDRSKVGTYIRLGERTSNYVFFSVT